MTLDPRLPLEPRPLYLDLVYVEKLGESGDQGDATSDEYRMADGRRSYTRRVRSEYQHVMTIHYCHKFKVQIEILTAI